MLRRGVLPRVKRGKTCAPPAGTPPATPIWKIIRPVLTSEGRARSCPHQASNEPFEHGDVHHEPSELLEGVGKNARDVGVSTRHAVGHDGSEEGEVDVPRQLPGRPSSPRGTDPPDDTAPTAVENFAPREATPPTVMATPPTVIP